MADEIRRVRTQSERDADGLAWRVVADSRPGYATWPHTPPGNPSWWRRDLLGVRTADGRLHAPQDVALVYPWPDPGGWGDVHQVVRVLPPQHRHQARTARRAAARRSVVDRDDRPPPPLVAPMHPEEPVTDRKRVRRSGAPWRILVHDWLGKKGIEETGFPYGKAHHVTSDPEFGRLPVSVMGKEGRAQADELRAEHSTETVLAGTEFDELVIGRWIHIEGMGTGTWWMNIGGVTVWVRADRDGRPTQVDVYGPNDYAGPVDGCDYSITWREEPA